MGLIGGNLTQIAGHS